jgi:hypothetical protein
MPQLNTLTRPRAKQHSDKAKDRDRVPNTYVGLARDLRRRITKAAVKADECIEAWLGPLRPRENFTPMVRHKNLVLLGERWQRLPPTGRLRCLSKYTTGKLELGELRLVPSVVRQSEWDEDSPSVTVILHTVTIQPPAFIEKKGECAILSLHCLSRFYQRGQYTKYDDVLEAIYALTSSIPSTVQAGDGKFHIPVESGGAWVGSYAKGDCALFASTFLADHHRRG